MADENDNGELESAERSTIATVKTKRAIWQEIYYSWLCKYSGRVAQ